MFWNFFKKNVDYSKRLDEQGWSEHYNIEHLNNVVNAVRTGKVSVWDQEILNICSGGELP